MYYVFSNSTQIVELANQEMWEKLMSKLKDAQLIIPESYHGVCPSAKEQYRNICERLFNDGKIGLLTCSKQVSKMFADCWDVEALSMMQSSKAKFGELHEDAIAVLKEYKHCKSLALKTFEENKNVKFFEKEVDGIRIQFNFGRLSFIKNEKEFIVFRGVSD